MVFKPYSLKQALSVAQTCFFILLFHIASAQLVVKGKVSDEVNKPLGFVIVSLRQGTSVVGNEITDSTGSFQFRNVKKGDYSFVLKLFSCSDTLISAHISNDTLISVQIRNNKLLPEAVVRVKKPIIQMEIDRLRFNVAGTDLVFGNTVWDVIEKTPLVNASDDGTIRIAGTTGAVVYINNKRKVLSGAALKAYLNALPSDNVEAIEVITTPSGKYGSEGGAGILNIVTKKNKQDGFDGNAVISDRQTAVNSQSGSVFLNDRTGKLDIYSDVYGVNRRRKPIYIQDFYFPPSASDALVSSSVRTTNNNRVVSAGANLGIDYQFNHNHVAGLLFDYSGDWNNNDRDALSYDKYAAGDSLNYSNNNDKINSQTYSLNLNYDGTLDSAGKRLSVDLDALHYISSYHSLSRTDGLDDFRSSSPQEVSNESIKTDFKCPFSKQLCLETGVKLSFSQIDNDLLFENNDGSTGWIKDNTRSNVFKYDEDIAAGYVVLDHKVNARWAYQVGTRLEKTVAKGYLNGMTAVDRNYVNVFPTGFLQFSPRPKQTYVLAVSSRITRPGFWDVNPFRTYTTDKTYWEGNPFLQPSRYYREELRRTLIIKQASYTFLIAAGQTLNEIYSLPYHDTGNVVVFKKVNYGNKYSYTGSLVYFNQVQPWWQFTGTILTGYVRSVGNYADIPIDNKTFLLSLSANQTFTISRKGGLTATVIANNTFPSTIVNTRIGDRLDAEIRVRKSAGPFNVTLAITDVFKANKDNYLVHANGLTAEEHFYYDTRSIALTVNYNFGRSTVKKNRERDTQFQDVKSRIS
jgi:hypothetical protein